MSVKKANPSMSLGDAMKAAKKTYKKHHGRRTRKHRGGQLMGKGTVAGGRRTRKHRKHRGGQLYTFAGGTYTGSALSDGAERFPPFNLNSMQWPGANPAAMSAGRRRTRRRHHRK
jgi:hypothetical protein